jgi:hypothetical protein
MTPAGSNLASRRGIANQPDYIGVKHFSYIFAPSPKAKRWRGLGRGQRNAAKKPPKPQKKPLQPSLKAVNSRSGRHHKATFSVSALGQQLRCSSRTRTQTHTSTATNNDSISQLTLNRTLATKLPVPSGAGLPNLTSPRLNCSIGVSAGHALTTHSAKPNLRPRTIFPNYSAGGWPQHRRFGGTPTPPSRQRLPVGNADISPLSNSLQDL